MTPITDFLKSYADSGMSRFHMPGHKGVAPQGYPEFLKAAMPFDLTEIKGADELYEPEGIIARSEEMTASLYGSGYSCYSAGGSTLSILTMVTAAMKVYGSKVIAVRNAHLAFVNACAHNDAEICWLIPQYDQATGLCLPATADEIAGMMDLHPDVKIVYLTSPDYYGVMAPISEIAAIVHQKGGILLVDNAHGAHLCAFPGLHPMEAGADLCCDSPHKTLPVLTGGSLLHCQKGMEAVFPKEMMKHLMTLFGSTSPSYLIMASLEQASNWMLCGGKEAFLRLTERIDRLKTELIDRGMVLLDRVSDCTKLTLDAFAMGYTDGELAELMREEGMEPEFVGGGKIVLMFSPQTGENDFQRLISFAEKLLPKPAISYPAFYLAPEKVMELQAAVFSESEQVKTNDSVGRIAAENRIACPPGIPIVTAGEKIGEREKKMLLDSGIFSISVVK